MRRCEGVQLPSWSWASLSSRIIDRDYDLGCSSFCSSLVPWVICTSKYGKPHFHILETNGEPATWRRWRKFWDNHTCPQLFLALALEEGMMETGFQLPCNIPEKTFSSLGKLFTRLWPTCQCALDALVDRSQDIIHIDSEGGFLEKKHRSLTSCSSDGRKALLIALRLAGSPSNSGPRPSGISRPYCWSSRNLDVTLTHVLRETDHPPIREYGKVRVAWTSGV